MHALAVVEYVKLTARQRDGNVLCIRCIDRIARPQVKKRLYGLRNLHIVRFREAYNRAE